MTPQSVTLRRSGVLTEITNFIKTTLDQFLKFPGHKRSLAPARLLLSEANAFTSPFLSCVHLLLITSQTCHNLPSQTHPYMGPLEKLQSHRKLPSLPSGVDENLVPETFKIRASYTHSAPCPLHLSSSPTSCIPESPPMSPTSPVASLKCWHLPLGTLIHDPCLTHSPATVP